MKGGWWMGKFVSQLISALSAAPAAVARLQVGLQAGQSCHVEEVSGFGGNPAAVVSSLSDVKWFSLPHKLPGWSFKPDVVRMFDGYKG